MEEEKLNKQQLLQMLQVEEQENQRKCIQEINEILNKYGYNLEPEIVITNGGINSNLKLVPKRG